MIFNSCNFFSNVNIDQLQRKKFCWFTWVILVMIRIVLEGHDELCKIFLTNSLFQIFCLVFYFLCLVKNQNNFKLLNIQKTNCLYVEQSGGIGSENADIGSVKKKKNQLVILQPFQNQLNDFQQLQFFQQCKH
eukprot:TRINITY_DN1701_c0_g1_i6.p2 TRINITY_DN1701_c0_g1~~TRINITY_DN1701_c0_g1_i6.p2  ORF type:complete len:133 (-),score=4.06 TRINITY_DN1701_c0_g1_i6:111-509(-)